MNVTIIDFYNDVTGTKSSNTPVAKAALDRWNVPYFTHTKGDSTKKFWKVDVIHAEKARAEYKAEQDAKEARREKHKPKVPNGQDGPIGLMERMAAVEQELRTLNTQLSAFIAKFG